MGITNSNKELSTSRIDCGGSFKVKLSLAAAHDITANPTDIVLILDRSGSMSGSPLSNLKNGANKFIDIIDEATDSMQDGQIGFGSHIGIVSFATTATADTQLITSVSELKNAVNALDAEGSTNHADAFTKALQLFDPASSNEKVMIMFTDGETTAGGNPNTVAAAAKAQGITIYCIGLSGNMGVDEQALNDWSSDPDSSYVVITPSDAELEKIFEDLAKNITKPGATNIVIDEKVSPCFKITSLDTPTKGEASLIDNTSLQWKIDELGAIKSEGAVLEFTVQHNGSCSGDLDVNESIHYKDDEGNKVTFPSPKIEVDCGSVIIGETCPEPIKVKLAGCEDSVEVNAGDIKLTSLGRILQLDVTLKDICPNKRIALAVILTETDEHGLEENRGIKFLTIPPHTKSGCHDITVRCIKFVLPDMPETGSFTQPHCKEKEIKVKFIANYIDTDFECCHIVT